jgi:uncharacterized HAD superfamily protein
MKRSLPIIAVDIDDVLANHAESFVNFSNERWGTHLTVEDYDEHWAEMWQIDNTETEARANVFRDSGIISEYDHTDEALPILTSLSRNYQLIVITSRRIQMEKETRAWIANHYPGVFTEIHFAGIWEKIDDDAHRHTKADLCQALGVSYLIDDQLKHCIAAAKCGIQSLLFGDYTWNRASELPEHVFRVKDWEEIQNYFNKR